MLTKEGCRARQDRLRRRLSEAKIDAVAIVHPLEVYYFTGVLFPSSFPDSPCCCGLKQAAIAGWLRTAMPTNRWSTRAIRTNVASGER